MDGIHKFQDLLKELFQSETSDLDFGIYRILNYKRELIRKFIQHDLVNKVESAFAKYKDERLVDINGQSVLTPQIGKQTVEIRYIEPEFKRLMEV
jgi:hypothetical protein